MEKYLPYVAVAIAALGFILSHFRTKDSAAMGERCAKIEGEVKAVADRLAFLSQIILKDAVLSFHSPNPKHKEADGIIERLVQGEELSAAEIDVLADRIKEAAHSGEDKAARLKAALTLALIDEFLDAVATRKSPDVLAEFR